MRSLGRGNKAIGEKKSGRKKSDDIASGAKVAMLKKQLE